MLCRLFSAHHFSASLNMNREGGKTRTEHRTPNQPTPGLRLASIQHRTSKDGVAVIEQGRREGARRTPRNFFQGSENRWSAFPRVGKPVVYRSAKNNKKK
jgi:hypothetical protein